MLSTDLLYMTQLDRKDYYHGAALMQVVNHPSFTALNAMPDQPVDYFRINTDVVLYLKYASNISKGSKTVVQREDKKASHSWGLSFTAANKAALDVARTRYPSVYFAAVCGTSGVCLLSADELLGMVDLDLAKSETIRIDLDPGCYFRVGDMKRSRSDFPDQLFVSV